MRSSIAIAAVIILLPVFGAYTNCVDFESLTVGTQYGDPVGNVPGDIIFTEDSIPVSVHDFLWSGGGGTFNYCVVDTAISAGIGSGNTMNTNNINLLFDFTGLGYIPEQVKLEFAVMGGNENISVNGEPIFHDALLSVPNPIAPGVIVSFSPGVMLLDGPVETLLIGGQEFWMDNLCVAPPGSSAVSPATIATTWGRLKSQAR